MSGRYAVPKEIVESAKANGWTIEPTNNGRLKWTHPGGALVYSSKFGGAARAWENHAAQLRREMARMRTAAANDTAPNPRAANQRTHARSRR
jgi:hypothetical protein